MQTIITAIASNVLFAGVLAGAISAVPLQVSAGDEPLKPRLVLQITVDQLRGDLPTRYYDRLAKGGFRFLLKNGTWYTDAHHAHANTETIVGHTTLATGAHPSAHGMIGNVWLDRTTGYSKYNIEDPRYTLLTSGADVDKDTEIDPTQRVARSEGRSPAAILTTTFSDELAVSTNGKAKIFAVSIKDRGAVSMAGHAGKAFWFSKASAEFVTSSYYYEQYPRWVNEWNQRKPAMRFAEKSWELLNPQADYLFGGSDDQSWETDLAGFGRTFPHSYGPGDGKYFTTLLTVSPAGDELTLDFARQLLIDEELGKDDIPDYLSISFSSTDYVGHLFGPSSLEAEDNLLRLDKTLASLLAFVDKHVGLDNTLVVLSADHGGPDAPGYSKQFGIDAGYIDPNSWDRAAIIDELKARLGIKDKLIETYQHPYVYLSREVMQNQALDHDAVERAVAAAIARLPAVALAVSSNALLNGRVPDTELYHAVLNNFNSNRSGQVYVVFEPDWFINDFDGLEVSSTHGSPWRYDTYVPIIFMGPGIQAQRINRRVHTIDVAVTLANLLGTKPPSGASGQVLLQQ